jgi:hypothetical protein
MGKDRPLADVAAEADAKDAERLAPEDLWGA